TLDETKQNLIVFDDIVLEKDQSVIKDHMIRGRKKNCSYIYLTQSYFTVPKVIRLQMTHFILFNIDNRKELRTIADTHATRVEFKDFMRFYKSCMAEKDHAFVYIDTTQTKLPMYLRCGFNGLYWDFPEYE